jgi:Flp pilus assembly protein TadD
MLFRVKARCTIFSVAPIVLLVSATVLQFLSQPAWAQQTLGSIIGRIRVEHGDAPPQRVLVDLDLRGASMSSVYTDAQGTFGFHMLAPNSYTVIVADDHYQPVQKVAVIEATTMSPLVFVDITLVPRKTEESAQQKPAASGSNQNMIDAREYAANFPKPAVKEFEKGLAADQRHESDAAIRHYQKAIAIAPEFYFAHNNLGSDYLSKSDFEGARKEFEQVVRLNQSDADAYFNLSNVYMLTGHLPEAQQYLDEGMRRQPESALGQFLLGSLKLRLKQLPQAENALRRAIQLNPLMAQPRLQLVNLLLQQGRKEDAESLLRDFLSLFPDNSFSARAKQVLQRLESSPKAQTVPN